MSPVCAAPSNVRDEDYVPQVQAVWSPTREPCEDQFLSKCIETQIGDQELAKLVEETTPIYCDLILSEPYDFYRGKESITVGRLHGEFEYETHQEGTIFPAVVTYVVRLWDAS